MAGDKKVELFDIDAACREAVAAVRSYANEEALSRCDYQVLASGLSNKDVANFEDHDWFLLFDALGSRDSLGKNASELYVLATYVWFMSRHLDGLVGLRASAASTRQGGV